MPFIPPSDGLAVETDDACTVTMFRHGRYQAEMYYMKPFRDLPAHCHPDVEIQIYIPKGLIVPESSLGPVLAPDELHGGDLFGSRDKAFTMVSLQRWGDNTSMTSVAIQYKGYTSGPAHDNLIKRYYPNAILKKGYADVTRG